MRTYQEEYIANTQEAAALTPRRKPEEDSFEAYAARLLRDKARKEELTERNMELLRSGLMPMLDRLLEAGETELEELREFAGKLLRVGTELDAGLFCQIHQALLSLARQKEDRPAIIQELYWLGIGRHSVCNNKLVGLDIADMEPYMAQMRLYFAEAAAYLKYFEEINDSEARAYILRSTANRSMGRFRRVGDRTRLIKRALEVFQDSTYRDIAPELPWNAYIRATHDLMAASISYSREHAMSPQDVADIMESVQLVYNRQVQAARERGERLPPRHAFHYHAIEYYCGIEDLNRLLTRMERLMDEADPWDFSPEGMYSMISLPAFYGNYLQEYPELAGEREMYAAGLYRRVLKYMEDFPEEKESEALFLYLRQLAYTFVETEHSIPYADLLEKVLIRFAPDVYVHSRIVGEAAKELSRLILEEEPRYFDDMEDIRTIADPAEKQQAILDFAEGCGTFHDAGKLNFLDLYSRTIRQWLEEEYELARLHPSGGWNLLSSRSSTSRYAAAALGHHAWYDGSQQGYPASYRRLDHPERQMVDIIGLVDWLTDMTDTARLHKGIGKTFREAVEAAISLEGRRFSPLLTARLRDKRVTERIRQALQDGRMAAYRRMFDESGGRTPAG